MGYGIRLSDGQGWHLSCQGSDKGIRQWLDRLANILTLQKCGEKGCDRIIFYKMEDKDDTRQAGTGTARATGCDWDPRDRVIIRFWRKEGHTRVTCEVRYDGIAGIEYISMSIVMQLFYRRSIHKGGLPFHAALVEWLGRGILLAGPSGVGKSTCCLRVPDYWKPLCDDVALVISDKQSNHCAHPFPTWSDCLNNRAENAWDVQHSVPLIGIFFLEQAVTDEAIPLGAGQAAVLINRSAERICLRFPRRMDAEGPRQFRSELFDNACAMAKRIPAFRLRVSLHGRFWEEIEKAIS